MLLNNYYLIEILLCSRFFGGFGFSFGSQNGGGHQNEVPRGAEVVMDLEVTLEELYTGEFVEVLMAYFSW